MAGKKIAKAINYSVTILLFALLISMLFMVVSMRASGGEASLFDYQIKSVLSGSMEPGIQTGSIITVKETDENHSFKKNDVITFKNSDGMVVTHRINRIKTEDGKSVYVTKGDANDVADPETISQSDIMGMYSGFTIPYLGYVMTFLNSSKGAALLMILPGAGLLIYSVMVFRRLLGSIEQSKDQTDS